MLDKLRARYERRNPFALIGMALSDVACWLVVRVFPMSPRKLSLTDFNKVLLVNPAHIGDVVVSTAAIRRLKEQNKNISVGFVAGSWAKNVLVGHPGVDRVFIVDHWRLNRAHVSTVKKIWRYFCTWLDVRKLLLAEGYDAGVLLNSFSPNLAGLLWLSKIPVRVGYVSSGMSPLLTDVLPKPQSVVSEQMIQLKLVELLGIYGESANWLSTSSNIPTKNQNSRKEKSPFIVLHPGTGNPAKSWSLEGWIELAEYLEGLGWQLVLTGQGSAEYELAKAIEIRTNCVNLVNKLTWDDWIETLAEATVVVGLDSAVGHICESIYTPFVGIYSGIGALRRWAPQGKTVKILTNAVECSPCHTRPCKGRPCIMSIRASEVGVAVSRFL